jgi:Zn-dependent protease
LAVFNLIPIPPLDGFKVAIALLPRQAAYSLSRIERYGPLLLLGLVLFLPYLLRVDLLGVVMHPVANLFLRLFLR